MTQQAAIDHILSHHRTVAVVGLSPKPHRASYEVSEYIRSTTASAHHPGQPAGQGARDSG